MKALLANNRKAIFIWGAGFIALFLINLIVEFVVFPLLGLNNTPGNDVYFLVWWVAVAFWFGVGVLRFLEKYAGEK